MEEVYEFLHVPLGTKDFCLYIFSLTLPCPLCWDVPLPNTIFNLLCQLQDSIFSYFCHKYLNKACVLTLTSSTLSPG